MGTRLRIVLGSTMLRTTILTLLCLACAVSASNPPSPTPTSTPAPPPGPFPGFSPTQQLSLPLLEWDPPLGWEAYTSSFFGPTKSSVGFSPIQGIVAGGFVMGKQEPDDSVSATLKTWNGTVVPLPKVDLSTGNLLAMSGDMFVVWDLFGAMGFDSLTGERVWKMKTDGFKGLCTYVDSWIACHSFRSVYGSKAGVIVYDGTTGKKVSFLPTNATITLSSCNSVLLVATTVGNTTVFSGYTLPHMTQTFSKTLHNPLSPFLSCTPQGPLIALDLTYGQTSTTYVVLDTSSGATFASWTIPSPYCFQGSAGVVNGNPLLVSCAGVFAPGTNNLMWSNNILEESNYIAVSGDSLFFALPTSSGQWSGNGLKVIVTDGTGKITDTVVAPFDHESDLNYALLGTDHQVQFTSCSALSPDSCYSIATFS